MQKTFNIPVVPGLSEAALFRDLIKDAKLFDAKIKEFQTLHEELSTELAVYGGMEKAQQLQKQAEEQAKAAELKLLAAASQANGIIEDATQKAGDIVSKTKEAIANKQTGLTELEEKLKQREIAVKKREDGITAREDKAESIRAAAEIRMADANLLHKTYSEKLDVINATINKLNPGATNENS